jgi:hypothetical protein
MPERVKIGRRAMQIPKSSSFVILLSPSSVSGVRVMIIGISVIGICPDFLERLKL